MFKALKMEEKSIINSFLTNELKIKNGEKTRHIKLVIDEAYDSFIAIQHVRADFAKWIRIFEKRLIVSFLFLIILNKYKINIFFF